MKKWVVYKVSNEKFYSDHFESLLVEKNIPHSWEAERKCFELNKGDDIPRNPSGQKQILYKYVTEEVWFKNQKQVRLF